MFEPLFNKYELIWGMFYCPHYFPRESPEFHVDILQEAKDHKKLAANAPRGSAKSVLLGFLKPTHGICHKKYRFIIIVQNTYAKSAASLNNIKSEFKENKNIINDYQVKLVKDAEGDTIFRHPDGFTTRVLCKGADQLGSIRGERFGAYRPDLILIDDLEDDEMVRNPERRQELEKQFNEVIKYAGDTETQTVVIGTILHDDSLMAKLVSKDQYKDFRKLFFKARFEWKGSVHSIWPEKWTVEDLNKMENEDPVGFAKEMQGDPSSGSLETIRREDFRYWTIENNKAVLFNEDNSVHSMWDLKDCKAAIANDLAWEEKQSSDFAASVPGLLTPANDLLIDYYIEKKGLRPDELEEIMFNSSAKYEQLTGKRVPVGFEKAKLEKVMKWFLQEAQKRRNKWLWLKDVNWGTKDKIERIILRVGNRYAQHSVYHRKGMGSLENQLIRLRSVAHEDVAECVGMLAELLAHAPTQKKSVKPEDKFEYLRKQTHLFRSKQQAKSVYVFGQKKKTPTIF
jgi:hypothetical protein